MKDADGSFTETAVAVAVERRSVVGIDISIAGALAIIAQGLFIIVFGAATTLFGFENEVRTAVLSGIGIGFAGFLGIVIGLVILAGVYLMQFPEKLGILGSAVVLAFSILSILIGGGWIVGMSLGVAGGILGLFRK